MLIGTNHIKQDLCWLERNRFENERVSIKNVSEEFAMMALMGPDTARIANDIGASQLNDLKYFQSLATTVNGIDVYATRISYVGESGWEMICPKEDVRALFQILNEKGASPAGLYAQTSMRIEKRYLAIGHDLNTDLSPLEAGLEFAVHWESDFIGRDALKARKDKGIESSIVQIVLNDANAVPLGSEPVSVNNEFIGKISSAAFGYRIGKPVAMAELKLGKNTQLEGLEVDINIAMEIFKGVVLTKPAFDPEGRVMRSAAAS